jgi:hypothetical protein
MPDPGRGAVAGLGWMIEENGKLLAAIEQSRKLLDQAKKPMLL